MVKKDKKIHNMPDNHEDDIYDPTDDLDDMVIDMNENECSPEEYVEHHLEEVRQYMMNLGSTSKKSKINPNEPKVTTGIILSFVLLCTLIVWLCSLFYN